MCECVGDAGVLGTMNCICQGLEVTPKVAPMKEMENATVQTEEGLVRDGGEQVMEDVLSGSEETELYPEGCR